MLCSRYGTDDKKSVNAGRPKRGQIICLNSPAYNDRQWTDAVQRTQFVKAACDNFSILIHPCIGL